MYLFSNIRYRVSGQEIENLNYPGETTISKKTVGLNQLWYKKSNVYAKNGFDIRMAYIIDQPKKKWFFQFLCSFKAYIWIL